MTFSLVYAFSENYIAAAVARRGGAREGLAARRKMPGDEWRRFANLRALFGLYVGAPRQAAPVHGLGVRPGQRVVGRTTAWTGGCWTLTSARRPCAAPPPRPERPVPLAPAPCGEPGHFTGRVRLDDLQRRPGQRAVLPAVRQEGRRAGRGRGRRPARGRASRPGRRAGQRDRGVRRELLGAAARRLPAWPADGRRWREVLNTDAIKYGGSGVGNLGSIVATQEPWHGQPASAQITLPPLGVLWLVPEGAHPAFTPEPLAFVLTLSQARHRRLTIRVAGCPRRR